MNCCLLLLAAALAAACSTTAAPGVCCIGPEACDRLGLDQDRLCPAGQACVDLQCVVPACTNQGCSADAPICEPETGACRGCRADTECPSGACAADGACVAEQDVVYLAPDGEDVAPCSRDAPCRGLQFGVRQTNGARNHVVMKTGTYAPDSPTIDIDPMLTPAPSVHIHGGGARLEHDDAETLVAIGVPTTIQDLELLYPGTAISTFADTTLRRVQIRALDGVSSFGSLKLRGVSIQATGRGLVTGGAIDVDGAVISGGVKGIATTAQTSVQISNLLVSGTSDTALDLTHAVGTVSFSTIAGTGMSAVQTPGVACNPSGGVTVRATIIWTPDSTQPSISGCAMLSVIAGPIGVAGASNSDPRFVDPGARDYHLDTNSPARDMVDAGPMTDFEGDPRPRGARFDIGADEAP